MPPSFLALPVCSQHAMCFTVALRSWGSWVGAVASSHSMCAPANSGQNAACFTVALGSWGRRVGVVAGNQFACALASS